MKAAQTDPGAKACEDAAEHYAVVKQLFREHNRALVNFLLTRLRSEQEALDVAQEAYVKLLQLHRPGAVSFLRGYLFRIAANLSVDRVRQRFVQEKAAAGLFDELAETEPLEQRAITREEFDLACAALNDLSPKHREAFVLHVIEGYSTPEVAVHMNVDERTVRKYVTRALLHCRQRLRKGV
jgi:RNA polymerase sigma factor (sigma-70 family)